MKNYISLLVFLISFLSFGQKTKTTKLDKIIKRDYTIIEGSISKISDKSVEYTLPNETLLNVMDVAQIARIEYASGRTQTFDVATAAKTESVSEVAAAPSRPAKVEYLPIVQNTLAVLPIPFVNSETLASSEEMAKFAQNDMYSKLIEKSSNIFPLNVQDLRVTNNLLRKAGIDYKNIDEAPIEELQKILGVDNVIAAKVSYTIELQQTTTGYASKEVNKSANGNQTRVSDFDESSTETNKKFKYKVYFDLYKNNSKTYTQSRVPFFDMKNSWMDSMSYLLKRCPIYTK